MTISENAPRDPNLENASPSAVTRRSFARQLGLVGIAAAGAALVTLIVRRRGQQYPVTFVADAGEIPVGGSKVFPYPENDRPCFLLRPAEDSYIAFSRLCTHHGCPVFFHPDQDVFACPCHGGVFSAKNGAVLQGPPPRPLPQVILERRGSKIFATGFVKTA